MSENGQYEDIIILDDRYRKEMNFWMEKLENQQQSSISSFYYTNYPAREKNISAINISFPNEISNRVRSICNNSEHGIFMFMLCGVSYLLNKYSGTEDIMVGSPVLKQKSNTINSKGIIPLVYKIERDMNFKDMLSVIKKVVVEANTHQNIPYENMVYLLGLEMEKPFFNTLVLLENIHDRNSVDNIAFEVKFEFAVLEQGIELCFEYDSATYDKGSAEQICRNIIDFFREVTNNPNIRLLEIQILAKEEIIQILYGFNSTEVEYPKEKTIHELFEEQAKKTPDSLAVVYEGKQLTYKELNYKSNQLAWLLNRKGIKQDKVVGLMVERSVEMVVGILGILKAGGAYMPIDPTDPKDRIKYMLKDSGASILLLQKQLMDKAEFEGEIIQIGEAELFEDGNNNTSIMSNMHNLAYVMYTSGSTGKPKGVMVEHMNVVRLVKNPNYITFKESDRILQTGTPAFDATTFEIWGALLNGFRLYLTNEDTILNADKLEKYIKENEISILWLTSALFNLLSEQNLNIFKTLRYLLVGGDVLSVKHINNVMKAFSGLTLINGYGPTENTTFSTCHTITGNYEVSIPIGKPISNSKAYILDENMKPVPIGVPGELCVGGDGLARGYLNNVELTAEKFKMNPFVEGERIYKTGDLAKWRYDGTIEFLSRIDNQVKIRGFRIELGEIEAKLLKHKQIKEAIVLAKEDESKNKYLCAYIVSDEEITVSELRTFLSEELPEYMQPSYFIKMDKFPLNKNGKIDKKLLPEPERAVITGVEYVAPENELEVKLAKIWKAVLGVDRVGVMDNFFELGGHSLKATALAERIQKEFGIDISLREIFREQTLINISEYISKAGKNIFTEIEPVSEKEYYKASPAQKRMFILNKYDSESLAYNLPILEVVEGKLDLERVEKVFSKLIKRHESLRTYFEIVNDEIVQKVADYVDFAVEYKEVTREELSGIIRNFIRPFDLSRAPLVRLGIAELGYGKYIFLLDMHHIIMDFISRRTLFREFEDLYCGKELPQVKLHYKDFSEWYNNFLKTEALKKQEGFWIQKLKDITTLKLPLDYTRNTEVICGDCVCFKVGKYMTNKLNELAVVMNSTLHMVLLTAYYILLHKYTDQEDIIIGMPVSGRHHQDTGNIIGLFVNTLAVRNYPSKNLSIKQFIEDVRDNFLEIYSNQDYQFDDLVNVLNVKRESSRNPLFDTMFNFLDDFEISIEDLKFKHYIEHEAQTSLFDLELEIQSVKDTLSFTFLYNANVLKRGTVERFMKGYIDILINMIENKNARIEDIKLKEIS